MKSNNSKEFKIIKMIILIRGSKIIILKRKKKPMKLHECKMDAEQFRDIIVKTKGFFLKRRFLFISFLIVKTFSNHDNVRVFVDSNIIDETCFK